MRPKQGKPMTVREDQEDADTSLSVERDPFIMLPLWMLEASANAIKLYAVLRRYANNTTLNAWPGKQTLATDMGYKHAKNIDPALRELEEMGAVVVTRRVTNQGAKLTNNYHVVVTTPRKQAPKPVPKRAPVDTENRVFPVGPIQGLPPTENPVIPVGPEKVHAETSTHQSGGEGRPQKGMRVGPEKVHELRTNELRTNELEPAETAVSARADDELPIEGIPGNVVALNPRSTQQLARAAVIENVAKQAYEDVNRSVAYMGLRKITTWAAGQGYHPEAVSAAFRSLFQNGRAVTQQTVAQHLAGIINNAGQASRQSTTQQRMTQGQTMVEKLRAKEQQMEMERTK